MADITIVDNIIRAYPRMIEIVEELREKSKEELEAILKGYDNEKTLSDVLIYIRDRLGDLAKEGI